MIVDESRLDLEVDETQGAFTVVVMRGELDLEAAPGLRDVAVELLREGHDHLILDLTAVTFIDSIGLGMLVRILKRLEAIDGGLSLVCDQDEVLAVIEMSGLTSLFETFPTLDEATAGR